MEKGLLVHVLRSPGQGDCTNGGVSSLFAAFVLVKNGEELGPFVPLVNKHPALYLAKWCGRVIACPANLEVLCPPRLRNTDNASSISHLGNWMFGGNYVESSDSRFHAINDYPIPIYDRREA